MTGDFRADLHCHTICSDGTETPQTLIEMASSMGLRGLSITDHDTIEAYQEALPFAKAKNFPLISGIEFSAVHNKTSVHILAYSFPLPSPPIEQFCIRHHQRRTERNQAILDLLAYNGMPLTLEDFPDGLFSEQSHHSIGRPHIAMAMVKKGYVKSIQEAFQQHIGENKPSFASGESRFSVEETLEIIHQANGLAVIAHPHLIDNVAILRDLLTMNFDGIEGYYARFPREQQERWIKIGARKGWLITGGSDFHGTIKPGNPLGSSWVNEETFNVLHQHFQRNQSI